MFTTTNGRTTSTFNLHLLTTCAAAAIIAWGAGPRAARAQTLLGSDALFTSAPACVPGQISVPIVEWDLDPITGDVEAGAIAVDVHSSSSEPNRVWFVTRLFTPRLYRFIPGRGRRDAVAQWRSWMLDPLGGEPSGGLMKIRSSKDKRNVFVRTVTALQQVDTQCKPTTTGSISTCSNALTVYRDRPFSFTSVSDVAIDDSNNVFTSAPEDEFMAMTVAYVQKLNPNAVRTATAADKEALGDPLTTLATTVTRWAVGGGAGTCPSSTDLSEYGSCLAGIDVDDKNQHLVYYVEPFRTNNNIAELNTKASGYNVRYWSLDELAARLGKPGEIFDPRQLKVERENGKTVVWVVTGSGHLIRLVPQSGDYAPMSAHRMPEIESDPFGLAPDGGVVGYTAVASSSLEGMRKDKVGMLQPKDKLVQVKTNTRPVPPTYHPVRVDRLDTETITGDADPDKKVAAGRVFRNEQGDTFVDAFINEAKPQPLGTLPSRLPMGITPDRSSKVGTFFYAVGAGGVVGVEAAINRIGLAFLPPAERPKHARDDDDFDGDGKKNRHEDDDDDDDGKPNHMDRDNDNDCRDDEIDDHDDDNDGNDDKWDDPRKKETRDSRDHTTAGGGFTNHQVVVPAGSTLLVAQATASSLSAPLRVEILGPTGVKLASPLPTPGVAVATAIPLTAGTYTVRVTNLGLTAATLTTDLIVQELWPALAPIVP